VVGVTSAVSVTGLRVVRGGRIVLDALDLEVERGEITGLLGPSGCGKSTLMRAIVGVQIVAGGTVAVLGQPAGTPELRRIVGYVTQAPSVYADLSVRDNFRYFGAVLGVGRDRVEEVLDTVDLVDHAASHVGKLSGGQRARASLGIALLGRPRLLVLDEPTVGQDPVLRESLWGTFRRLADAGATLLVSSHVMDEATRCDRLLLMRDGGLLAADRPDAILARTGARTMGDAFLRLIAGGAP
jgi:ABC-2 type transport system ATP-binding protein